MHVLTRITQSPDWVDQERAAAERALREHTPTPYGTLRQRTILATLDWIEGKRTHAPGTGRPRIADDDGLAAERRDAGDREEDLWAIGDQEGATRAGIVAEVLAAYLCDPMAESPS